MARQLNGYARCEGCGTSYAACPDVYECAECEEDEKLAEGDEIKFQKRK